MGAPPAFLVESDDSDSSESVLPQVAAGYDDSDSSESVLPQVAAGYDSVSSDSEDGSDSPRKRKRLEAEADALAVGQFLDDAEDDPRRCVEQHVGARVAVDLNELFAANERDLRLAARDIVAARAENVARVERAADDAVRGLVNNDNAARAELKREVECDVEDILVGARVEYELMQNELVCEATGDAEIDEDAALMAYETAAAMRSAAANEAHALDVDAGAAASRAEDMEYDRAQHAKDDINFN